MTIVNQSFRSRQHDCFVFISVSEFIVPGANKVCETPLASRRYLCFINVKRLGG